MEDRYLAGFTLVELLLTLAVLGITLALAVPAMTQFIERNRLRSAAESLVADIHLARSEAIKSARHGTVHLNFKMTGGNWCYGLDYRHRCDCFKQQTASKTGCSFHTRLGRDFPGITLTAARFSGTSNTWFEGIRGTARAGHIAFRSDAGNALQVKISALGRARICSPEENPSPGGYPLC